LNPDQQHLSRGSIQARAPEVIIKLPSTVGKGVMAMEIKLI
jgi:hypothetical protein